MLESLLKRDRYLILVGLAAITLLSWAYLFFQAQDMARMEASVGMSSDSDMGSMSSDSDMGSMSMNSDMGMAAVMPQTQAWSLREFGLMFLMWSVMMVAMMLPSAAPMILLFAAANRKQESALTPFPRTSAFIVGYLLVWIGFSLLATATQGILHAAALLSPMMATTNSLLAAILLVAAGLYQWSPLKYACLHHCRSPLAFMLNEWRAGSLGALRMGLKHGIYCLGCCWSLMLLLFVAGVMNLLWIAILAVLVLVEKVAPSGQYLSRIMGIVFVIWGVWLAVGLIA
jgi:predicted metal-binding membrane protein